MPRPKVDAKAVSGQLLDEAEALLEESGGRRLILSDVAARAGMSQSYAHRFFPTKADLIHALAERWFKEVQKQSNDAACGDEPAGQRLENWLLAILRTKRDAYDRNPSLFLAYLEMAGDHQDLVMEHVGRLQSDLKAILADLKPNRPLADAVALVEDATLLFRTPHNIARYRVQATDQRAKAIIQMLIEVLPRPPHIL